MDDKIYVGSEYGIVMVFKLSADPRIAMREVDGQLVPIRVNGDDANTFNYLYSSPVFANGVLFMATRHWLFAITPDTAEPAKEDDQPAKPPKIVAPATARDKRRAAGSIFLPTPQDVVEAMVSAVEIAEDDTVVDLGSGDGRIVIAAATTCQAKAIGYEIDPALVSESRDRVKQSDVQELVEIRQQDMYEADLSDIQVVFVFLYPPSLEKLKSQFTAMKANTWIVSHHFEIPGWTPTRVVTVDSRETGNIHKLFCYQAPTIED